MLNILWKMQRAAETPVFVTLTEAKLHVPQIFQYFYTAYHIVTFCNSGKFLISFLKDGSTV